MEKTSQTNVNQDGNGRTETEAETVDGVEERVATGEAGNTGEQPRRSERIRRRPIRLNDYITY